MTARRVRRFNFAPALAMKMTYLQRADQYLRVPHQKEQKRFYEHYAWKCLIFFPTTISFCLNKIFYENNKEK